MSKSTVQIKPPKHIIILNIVGLKVSYLSDPELRKLIPNLAGLGEEGEYGYLKPVFPAVTCTVQSSILTGTFPNKHGIISNGFYDRENLQVSFWEQSSNLVKSEKIWDNIKKSNTEISSALLFWQNSMYSNNDIIVTPRPIHLENGNMEMWCYSKPVNYYEKMSESLGTFNLFSYWGPFASLKSSEWISKSVQYTLKNKIPNLLLAYFPQLDYTIQKYGTHSKQVLDDLTHIDSLVGNIIETIKEANIYDDTHIIIISEYGFNDVNDAVPINRILRENNFLAVRTINGKEYIDFEHSTAFAMVDHQVAHIYINNLIKAENKKSELKKVLLGIPGVDKILDDDEKKELKIDHPKSGDLIAIAKIDKWFSYYWWYDNENNTGSEKAPSFTKTVDIHRKPGYDPMELFIDPATKSISFNVKSIKGSHGRPCDLDTGEGLAAYISNRKLNNIDKQTYNEKPLMDCTQIFDIIKKNFGS